MVFHISFILDEHQDLVLKEALREVWSVFVCWDFLWPISSQQCFKITMVLLQLAWNLNREIQKKVFFLGAQFAQWKTKNGRDLGDSLSVYKLYTHTNKYIGYKHCVNADPYAGHRFAVTQRSVSTDKLSSHKAISCSGQWDGVSSWREEEICLVHSNFTECIFQSWY